MASRRARKLFLDANVVIRAGRPPGGPLIPRVADLVDPGYVKVVTTDLTRLHQLRGLGDAKVLRSLGRSPKGRHYRG